MTGVQSSNEAQFRKAVFAIAAIATCAYAGWLGQATLSIGDRLTRIETRIDENRDERQGQVADIRARLQRLEGDVYYSTRAVPGSRETR